MDKKDISSRDDIALLVRTFYEAHIQKDPSLGPIFNGIITDWDAHIALLTDFWESQLFLNRSYKGDPVRAHILVDASVKNTLSPAHFGQWINLWFATIDSLFKGPTAWMAKNRAQKMSTMLFLKIFEARQD